jgi:hypothetical protein
MRNENGFRLLQRNSPIWAGMLASAQFSNNVAALRKQRPAKLQDLDPRGHLWFGSSVSAPTKLVCILSNWWKEPISALAARSEHRSGAYLQQY